MFSPGRHLFYLLRGLHVLFAPKQSAQVAYKPNWRFRYVNILRSIMRVGRYAMIQHAITRPGWWVFTAGVAYAQDAEEGLPSRWRYTLIRILDLITDRNISTPTPSYITSCYTSCLSLTATKPSAPSKILSHIVRTIRINERISLTYGGGVILEHISDVITKNTVLLQSLRECVGKHLNNCGRRWVDLKTIFSLMKV